MSNAQQFEKFVYRRNDFYRNQFRRMVHLLMVLLLTASGLLGLYLFVSSSQAPARYYASTTTGEVVPIESLSSPVVTPAFIQQWASTVARSAYSINFLNYEKQFSQARPYFTTDGWNAFQNAMASSGFLDTVKNKKLYLSTVVNGPVVIVKQYISSGHYSWDVQLPLLILYSSSNMNVKRQIMVSMTIKRIPELENARGIAVTKFTMGGDALNG